MMNFGRKRATRASGRTWIDTAVRRTGSWAFIVALCALPFVSSPARAQTTLYHELYRPQFHFSPAQNWMKDPNGLIYYKGQYHLFFQYNPSGTTWGNISWDMR